MNALLLTLTLGVLSLGATPTPARSVAPSAPPDTATFAGGRFWVLERLFEDLNGVLAVTVGYTGGRSRDPNYREVSSGRSGHYEAVQVVYDPDKITYHSLLVFYWRNIDPLAYNGQFCDSGTQYGTAIIYHNPRQQALAENTKLSVLRRFRERSIPTKVLPAGPFYPAADFHQDYARKDSTEFERYRIGCGRETRLAELWGRKEGAYVRGWEPLRFERPSDAELRAKLTQLQYQVTQAGAMEPARDNEFWNHEEPGIYIDVVSTEPLFGSPDKISSESGWPTFTQPLHPSSVVEYPDSSGGEARTAVRSTYAGSHLGYVVDDPATPTGKRYRINSAALRFIPADSLMAAGYREYTDLFTTRGRYFQPRD